MEKKKLRWLWQFQHRAIYEGTGNKGISVKNKKAYYDYHIIDEFTAGIVLLGSEVKSIRDGHANLQGSYCYLDQNSVIVKSMNVKEYPNACVQHEPLRERHLLLNKNEIAKIRKKLEIAGTTLIPLLLITGKTIKLKIGLAKGKKLYDKRNTIKERDIDRENKRTQI